MRHDYSTYPLEEHGSLPEDVTSLHQFTQPLAQQLITVVHLHQASLMLRQLHVQLVDSLRSTRADRHEGSRVVERANGDGILLLLDLAFKKADPAGHFVDAADFTDEGALERIDIGVQL